MRAGDGKMYLTDATDPDTILLLIQQIAPEKVGNFRKIFQKILEDRLGEDPYSPTENGKLSTANSYSQDNEDYELTIDAWSDKDAIIVRSMLAGVEPDDISIIATSNNILIKGQRKQKIASNSDCLIEELSWGKFSREIELPNEVDIDAVETKFQYGMLEIKIPLIDKSRTKIIKVK
jgi:HSP20 family protein